MTEPIEKAESIQEMVFRLWTLALLHAKQAGTVPAEAVTKLIQSSRRILSDFGVSRLEQDMFFVLLHSAIHFDHPEPTGRVFETLLEFELQEFYAQRGLSDVTRLS